MLLRSLVFDNKKVCKNNWLHAAIARTNATKNSVHGTAATGKPWMKSKPTWNSATAHPAAAPSTCSPAKANFTANRLLKNTNFSLAN